MLQSGIEIRVVNAEYGDKKEEFVAPPESPLNTTKRHDVYIEAADDEAFKVNV